MKTQSSNYLRTLVIIIFSLISCFDLFAGVQDSAANSKHPVNTTTGNNDALLIANLSSPRETWDSLVQLTDSFYASVKTNGFTPENQEELTFLEEQIAECFDLREVPPSTQRDLAMESAVYIREITARLSPIQADELPDEDTAYQELKEGHPAIWRIHDSPIAIVKITDGPYAGDFQFSSRSIEMAEEFYEHISQKPYIDPGVSGMYEAYFLTPGPMIPNAWVHVLPSWMSRQYLHNTIWQWIGTVIGLVILVILITILVRIINRIGSNLSLANQRLSYLLKPILIAALTMFTIHFLDEQIFVTGLLLSSIRFIQYAIVLCSGVFFVISLGGYISEWISSSQHFEDKAIDTYLIRLAIRLSSIIVSMIIIIEGLQKMGFSLATVLAGAGVTGLAIALAAQESLRNIFGSIMLLLDKPFKVGQRVKIRGHNGTVEEIGLRSTKIRLLSGHLSAIPNEDVARADIENIGERPYIRRVMNVTITYDTPIDKIDEAIAILQDILSPEDGDETTMERSQHVNNPNYPPRIYFSELNADSLNIMVIYWYHPSSYWEYLEFNHYVNRELIRRFNDAGIDFAFPTQTLYMAGDGKRPLDIGMRSLSPKGHSEHPEAPPVKTFAHPHHEHKTMTSESISTPLSENAPLETDSPDNDIDEERE